MVKKLAELGSHLLLAPHIGVTNADLQRSYILQRAHPSAKRQSICSLVKPIRKFVSATHSLSDRVYIGAEDVLTVERVLHGEQVVVLGLVDYI